MYASVSEALFICVSLHLAYSHHEAVIASQPGSSSCPGICVVSTTGQHCTADLNNTRLCAAGELCCNTKNQVQEIAVLDEILPKLDGSSDDKIECPSICLPNILASFCIESIILNTECELGYAICCDIRSYPQSEPLAPTTPTLVSQLSNMKHHEKNFFIHRTHNISDCPGTCMESYRISSCNNYLNDTSICSAGYVCCVNEYTTKKITTQTLQNEQDLVTNQQSEQSTIKLPLFEHRCQGECVFGLSIVFCLELDTSAACPSYGFCCLSEAKLPTTMPTTTTQLTTVSDDITSEVSTMSKNSTTPTAITLTTYTTAK